MLNVGWITTPSPTFCLHYLCIRWLRVKYLRWRRPVPRTFSWSSMVPGPQLAGPCLSRLDLPLDVKLGSIKIINLIALPKKHIERGIKWITHFLVFLLKCFFSTLLHQLYRYAALLILKRSHARPSARIKIQSFWCLERSPRTLEIQFQFLCDLHTRCFCANMSFLSSQRHFWAKRFQRRMFFAWTSVVPSLPWKPSPLRWGLEASSSPDFWEIEASNCEAFSQYSCYLDWWPVT